MANLIFNLGTGSLGVVFDNVTLRWNINQPQSAVPNQDGVIRQQQNQRSRTVRMTGRLMGADTTTLRTALNSIEALAVNAVDEVALKIHDDRFMNVALRAWQTTYIPGQAGAHVGLTAEFLASHPFFIDDSSFSSVQSITVGTFSFSVVNTGSAVTPATVFFVPRSGSPTETQGIRNQTRSETFTLTSSIAAGDEARVNAASKTIISSNGGSLLSDFSGTTLFLSPGTNDLLFTGSGQNVTIVFNPRYVE